MSNSNPPSAESFEDVRKQFKAAIAARDQADAVARQRRTEVDALRVRLIEIQLGGRVDQIRQIPPIDLGKAVSAYVGKTVRISRESSDDAPGPLIYVHGTLAHDTLTGIYSIDWSETLLGYTCASTIQFTPADVARLFVDYFGMPTIGLK